jgi:hypothetical protein
MKRTQVVTAGAVLIAALSLFDLASGWAARAGVGGLVAVVGLFAVAIALYAAMVIFGVRERRQQSGLQTAAKGIRRGAIFAIAFSVFLFANCSSAVTAGPTPGAFVVADDGGVFLGLSGLIVLPLLLALALPAALVTTASFKASSKRAAAERLARLATWAGGAIVLVALATAAGGFYAGMSSCVFGGSVGWCAAGLASVTNVLSLGALALLLPYVGLASAALTDVREGERGGSARPAP